MLVVAGDLGQGRRGATTEWLWESGQEKAKRGTKDTRDIVFRSLSSRVIIEGSM